MTYLPRVVSFSFLLFVAFIIVYDGVFLYVLYRKLARYRHAYHDAVAVDEQAESSRAD